MSEPKFTPGPWTAKPDDYGYANGEAYVCVDTQGGCLVHVLTRAQMPFSGKYADAPVVANAHLIAAAPELYAALVTLETACGENVTVVLDRPAFVACVEAARAALAKARGETP